MTFWVAGAVVVGSALTSNAANNAADAQSAAASDSNALQKYIYDQNREDQQPWMQAGRSALDKLNALLADGSITSKFAGDITKEPGYAFTAAEGRRAVDNSASARGGIGGAALKASARFAEGNANKYYNDAFNRFRTERQDILDPLYRIAGFGSSANTANAAGGVNMANQVGANSIFGAQAQAQNALAQGNIYGSAINQLGALGARQNWWNNPSGVNMGSTGWTDNPAGDPFYMGP